VVLRQKRRKSSAHFRKQKKRALLQRKKEESVSRSSPKRKKKGRHFTHSLIVGGEVLTFNEGLGKLNGEGRELKGKGGSLS